MQATTPLDPRVLDAMLPFYTEFYGNPHSRTHLYGWESEDAIERAREQVRAASHVVHCHTCVDLQVASLIGANAKEIIFTSGATESNNMAVKGVANFLKDKKNHIITTQTEHKCVLDSCRYLQQRGFEVTYLPVQANGLVDMQELEAAIRPETALVSVMMVNNEIGACYMMCAAYVMLHCEQQEYCSPSRRLVPCVASTRCTFTPMRRRRWARSP